MLVEEVRKILQIVPSEEAVLCRLEKQAIRNYIAAGVSAIIVFMNVEMKKDVKLYGRMGCFVILEMNMQKP